MSPHQSGIVVVEESDGGEVADVFISYKRDDRRVVERLAQELRRLGLNVWFDAGLSAGDAFPDEIDREARAAKSVLVCWSPAARESQWVKAEALIGFDERKLAACYVAGPDEFRPPAPFNAIHVEDLRGWVAAPLDTDPGYRGILRRVGALCGRADIKDFGTIGELTTASALRRWISTHGSSPLARVVDETLRTRVAEEASAARDCEAAESAQSGEASEARRRVAGARDREIPGVVLQNVELSISKTGERAEIVGGAIISLYREFIRARDVEHPLSDITRINAYPGMIHLSLTQDRMIGILATYGSVVQKLNPGPIQQQFARFAAVLSEKTFSHRQDFLADHIRNHGAVAIGFDNRSNEVRLTRNGVMEYRAQQFDLKQAQTLALGLDGDQDVVTFSTRLVQRAFFSGGFSGPALDDGVLRFALSNANRDVIWNLVRWLAQPGNNL